MLEFGKCPVPRHDFMFHLLAFSVNNAPVCTGKTSGIDERVKRTPRHGLDIYLKAWKQSSQAVEIFQSPIVWE